MNFTDPFSSNTDKFRKLIDKDQGVEYADFEEVLDNGTVKGLPVSKFKELNSHYEDPANKEKKEKAEQMFNQLFTDLNKKYGLSVTSNFDSFGTAITSIIDPSNKKAMEYYLSEAYGRFRVVLYGKYLKAISMLTDQILDPEYLLSESMPYEQKLETLQKLYEFMNTMNEIYKEVNIADTEMKLERLASDQKPQFDMKDPKIFDIMETIFKKATEPE